MDQSYLFTSESVSPGHPDKVADQISDAVLDACLGIDKDARVACETLVKSNLVVIAGELGSNRVNLLQEVDVDGVARNVIRAIGYDDKELGFDAGSCKIQLELSKQSENIAEGIRVESALHNAGDLGAGDQGSVFGYATDETDALMPAPIQYAHLLMKQQAELRATKELPWLRPDAKSQVTFEYGDDDKPRRVDTVVLSTQHEREVEGKTNDTTIAKIIRREVIEKIIKPVLGDWYQESIKIIVNPAGRFELGGPVADCGLTGRKIIVDTYGGKVGHGGGAFSGKDPSKVDRSAAYAARYIAKSIVALGMASECELQISYAIGRSEPVSIYLRTSHDKHTSDAEILRYIEDNFDLTPTGIIEMLDLKCPIYQQTAALGHFGREDDGFTWEQTTLPSTQARAWQR